MMKERTRFLILAGFSIVFLVFYYSIEVESHYYARDVVEKASSAGQGDIPDAEMKD
jgi:hypothetical protein